MTVTDRWSVRHTAGSCGKAGLWGGIGCLPAGGAPKRVGGIDGQWTGTRSSACVSTAFTVARRGYDRREVDKFLGALLDWLETDAPKDLGGMAVKRKFELAGKSTAQILLTTENESEQMLRQTEEECADLRGQAEAASRETRRAADEHAAKVREKADEDARRTGEAASAKAKRVVEEGERRRAQIDAVIAELEARVAMARSKSCSASKLRASRDDRKAPVRGALTQARRRRGGRALPGDKTRGSRRQVLAEPVGQACHFGAGGCCCCRSARRAVEPLGEFDDQAFGSADVAEEERVLEVDDLPDRFKAGFGRGRRRHARRRP